MPLTLTFRNFRQRVAHTSRAHLSQSVEIVRCCRIIVQDQDLAVSADGADIVEKVLNRALSALDVASNKEVKDADTISGAYEEAVTAILSVKSKTFDPNSLNIRARMTNARSKDEEVQSKKSSILTKHSNRSKGSAPDKSPRVKVDIRVREDIKDEKSQKIIPLLDGCRETDTLNIVLLLMGLRNGPKLQDNPHFYDWTLAKDQLDAKNFHRSALPFDIVLHDIPHPPDFLVLYCLHDHKSKNVLLLKSVDTQKSFANIWQVDVNKFILKETIGDLHSANWISSLDSISNVKIVKMLRHQNSEGSEVRRDTWLELFQEVYEAFKQEGDVYWTIEAKSSRLIPPRFTSQGRHYSPSSVSLNTVASGTSTLVATVPTGATEPDKEREDTKYAAFSIWESVKKVARDLVQPVLGP